MTQMTLFPEPIQATSKTKPRSVKKSPPQKPKQGVGDFYWAYCDILRGIGVNPSTYDQRIMAFMTLKLLVDNQKVKFNFDHQQQFGLTDELYLKYQGATVQDTFINLVNNISELGSNLNCFEQERDHNPDAESTSILYYINHKRTFTLTDYITELEPHYFLMVLDIYNQKADFTNYPKEKYKDLYEAPCVRIVVASTFIVRGN